MKQVTPSRKETPFELAAWPLWIGKQVIKVSRKTFTSGEKIATVTGMTINPITGLHAFTFTGDDRPVECFRTVLITGKPSWDDAPAWALGLAFKCYGDPGEFGEWCWMTPNGAPGFICFETRPMSHLEAADQRVQDVILSNYWTKQDQLAAHRQAQRERDLARNQQRRAQSERDRARNQKEAHG